MQSIVEVQTPQPNATIINGFHPDILMNGRDQFFVHTVTEPGFSEGELRLNCCLLLSCLGLAKWLNGSNYGMEITLAAGVVKQ